MKQKNMKTRIKKLFRVLALIGGLGWFAVLPARADTFAVRDFLTYGQGEWTSIAAAYQHLQNNFASVYASSGGVLVVGVPTATGFTIVFSGAKALSNYLPSDGPAGPLDLSLLDPVFTSSGVFGGSVVALKLTVDFSAAGVLPHPAGIPFGDLYLTGYDGTLSGLNGMTVNEFLAMNQIALGGGPAPISIADLSPAIEQLDYAFSGGYVSTFATEHLALPPPQISIFAYGADVVLAWPANAAAYVLQSTTSLTAPAWTTVSPGPVIVGNQCEVFTPISGTQKFYRLMLNQ